MPVKRQTKPPFKPTKAERKLVEQMCSVGIPQEDMCRVVRDGITSKTLRKHFRLELDTAATNANVQVGGTLFKKAISGDVTAAIWWSKTRMRWKDASRIEHTGKDGEPLPAQASLTVRDAVALIAAFKAK